MTTARRLHYSYEEYLGAEAESRVRLEYCDGVIYAMAGGTPVHGELCAAMLRVLGNAFLDRCRVHTSDVKVRVEDTDLTTYPDGSVVCGPRVMSPIDSNAVVNPILLVEVTSRSTEDYDRGDKLSHYKQLSSLRAVLIVSHRRPSITIVERTAAGWADRELRASEQVKLSNPELSFSVNEVYRGITLDP